MDRRAAVWVYECVSSCSRLQQPLGPLGLVRWSAVMHTPHLHLCPSPSRRPPCDTGYFLEYLYFLKVVLDLLKFKRVKNNIVC
jgi:hypothetical protein